jgi:rhodanese-related sulfurtransferase
MQEKQRDPGDQELFRQQREEEERRADFDVRIDPEEAAAKLVGNEAILLDVVSADTWAKLDHAARGAIRIPPKEIGRRWRELPREREIIAYCT